MSHQSCLFVPENKILETFPDYIQMLRVVKERVKEH